ncbi:KdsC family phosphatase [Niabella drilacis]|uniref:3-deoxy-D-manno-octulosonate 8-phosphate phosphatase (KDO 8-P phosphatase) n=1 Tax=Niabella drilacis (strain DSM 25811 / CCM 8410 / CCUG 62505 / LMG 26954 / E90) TaxID=1285928 RepID=A0A1G6WU57_NIADE|nr:HAD hydrolase family protein [Niabella drilacis]SDD68616.1 3-deoxy-D-manno-octulosonate 8-phosphate phosphatase (KDO 8-P phosphatase) [Niabella drilacis]
MNLLQRFQKIRTFIFDVDGVLTNGDLLVLESGEMARVMNVKDGYALQLALKLDYEIIVVSGSAPSAVQQRLNRLGIREVYFAVKDKKAFIGQLMEQKQLRAEAVLFMGDDLPDLPVFDIVGLSACPADAVGEVQQRVRFISGSGGGRGCVREVIEKVLRSNGHWGTDSRIAST